MEMTIIGIDPHKRSHTAVVLDEDERIAAEIRVTAGPRQVEQLLGWAPSGPRLWAVENANGLGWLLSRQLAARGERVVDVPASLAARARKLSGHSGRKTDAFDARSVVIAARHNGGLRQVTGEDDADLLGLLLARRDRLVEARKRDINQLHAMLTEMVEGGAKSDLTPTKASRTLARYRPTTAVGTVRKQLAHELLADWQRIDRQLKVATNELTEAVAATGTNLVSIPGIATVGVATILSIVGDVWRFPTPGHFAASPALPLLKRPREMSRAIGSRGAVSGSSTRCCTSPRALRPAEEASDGSYYDRKVTEGKSEREALRCLKRQLSNVVYRRPHADQHAADQAARGGQHGTNPKAA